MSSSLAELNATCKESGAYEEFLAGRKDATIDITMHWDEEDDGQNKLASAHFSDTTVVVQYRMEEASGKDQHVVTCLVTAWNPDSPNDDIADISATLRVTGSYAPSTQ
jgi:hypothetical protein